MESSSEQLLTLQEGKIHLQGRMPNSSNATYFITLGDSEDAQAIYKPLQGERPLWDFEPGLYKREVAAYLVSETLGYHIIPPTVMRDGPLGVGSVQLFIVHDPRHHYFTFLEEHPETHDQLRSMAVFDIVANNTDRKGGHVLLDAEGHIWGIDQGLCFSNEFKLRTVIWDFAGEEIPTELLDPIEAFTTNIPTDISALLEDFEVEAMMHRCGWLLENRVFPAPGSRYEYPWPML